MRVFFVLFLSFFLVYAVGVLGFGTSVGLGVVNLEGNGGGEQKEEKGGEEKREKEKREKEKREKEKREKEKRKKEKREKGGLERDSKLTEKDSYYGDDWAQMDEDFENALNNR